MRLFFILFLGFCSISGLARSGIEQGIAAGDNPAGIEFVFIQGGSFEMGNVSGEGRDDEKPVHTVTVSGFYLGKTEVTVAQYRIFCNATNRKIPRKPEWGWQDDHPVVHVSWDDAVAFCTWAGCRLPSEAEWEYAARNRGERIRYSWGNAFPLGKKGGNVADESVRQAHPDWILFNGYDDGYVHTAPVGSFESNALGLYDMTGNVFEWCADWYGVYGETPQTDPRGPGSGTFRVLRGFSWVNDPLFCSTSSRFKNKPKISFDCYGFRAAR